MTSFYYVVVILILIVSVLLGLTVLVQNSKGGGLVSNFGGANQMMGVRQTTDFLEKATWTIAGILVVLCLVVSVTLSKSNGKDAAHQSNLEGTVKTSSMEVPAATMGDQTEATGESQDAAPFENSAEAQGEE